MTHAEDLEDLAVELACTTRTERQQLLAAADYIEQLEKAGTAMVNAETAAAYCDAENAWAELVGWTEDGAS